MAKSDAAGTTGASSRRSAAGVDFDQVQAAEKRFVEDRRCAAGFRTEEVVPDSGVGAAKIELPLATVGLALSGGGIRSASISLGLIQVLRKYGLFRYFDYISAISGGSYTAALVTSSFYRATGSAAEERESNDVRLDVDLEETTIQPPRVRALMNDGRYLMRPLEWANRFVSGWSALMLVVGSALLAVSALVAFVWRSMDFYVVRDYLSALGIGSDMWSALLPLLTLVVLWGVCWAISYFRDGASARGRWAKRVMVVLVVCAIVTIAGLIGNGDIELSDGMQKTATYLRIPIIVSIFGGLIPTFFRKQLFRSGLIESSMLEKFVYRYTALAVVLGIPMLLIGYFAQEDVARYGTTRDGRLLWGDVKDFPAFAAWLETTSDTLTKQKNHDPTNSTTRLSALAAAPGGTKSTDRIQPLLEDIRLLSAAELMTIPRVQGRQPWQVAPQDGTEVRKIDVLDRTTTKVLGPTGELKLAQGKLVPALDEQPSDTPQNYQLPVVSERFEFAPWLKWKYETIVTRVGVLFGHVFNGDSDDPLGLAVAIDRLRIEREKAVIDIVNREWLANPWFAAQLYRELDYAKPETISWNAEPWSFIPEGSRADVRSLLEGDQTAIEKISPDEVLEINRLGLELAHPDLVRRRHDIRRTVVIHADQLHRFLMFLMFGGIFVASALWINPNTTSIQRYYQERLASAYLGGSDVAHNMRLTDLAPRLGPGPLLLIGGAANYRFRPANKDRHPDSESLAQPVESTDRVGAFEFSPLYCGSRDLNYAATDAYCQGKLRLADAVAISGAALNPLYFERWEMLVIVGLFNLRLGQWMPNPSGGAISLKPTFAALMWDIFSWKDRRITRATERRHILLTDGGHFDNTGLQSLLERRCRMILACDSTQDREFHFDSLAVVIGRVKGQLGITFHEIGTGQELDLKRHSAAMEQGQKHHFCAEIRYPRTEQGTNSKEEAAGLLVYFKPSLTGDEPPFVWNHSVKNEAFPHDSTVNQSFSPAQFCAYLGLGQHLMESVVAGRDHLVQNTLAKKNQFDVSGIAGLFLSDLSDSQRTRFLARLSADGTSVDREFDRLTRRLDESIRAGKLDEFVETLTELSQALDIRKFPDDCCHQSLDALADAIVTLDDVPRAEATKAIEQAANQFVRILVTVCERGPKRGRKTNERTEFMGRIAAEIRARFQRPGQFRSVRPILRAVGDFYTDELLECLICDGDAAQDGFILEVLGEAGERLAQSNEPVSAKRYELLATKQFSSNSEIRDFAERLIELIDERQRSED